MTKAAFWTKAQSLVLFNTGGIFFAVSVLKEGGEGTQLPLSQSSPVNKNKDKKEKKLQEKE